MAKTKNVKAFWAITSLIVVALLMGGWVVYYAYDNQVLDNVYSTSFQPPEVVRALAKKLAEFKKRPPVPVKSKTSTSTKPATTTSTTTK